ncbi:MAG: hypothetical protein QOE70_3566 [Chthoniobacter sp.]|jgi:acyl-CoA thioesterase-1|nr:hypothetical protein [Chthoniobacter sp.]
MNAITRPALFAALALWFGPPSSAQETKTAPAKQPDPAFQKVEDVPGLPRVLLIGDSISIGYTVPVQKLLAGKANVHRIPTNGGPTTTGLAHLDEWLGDKKWNAIHFNWGLHDLKWCDEKGNMTDVGVGRQQVSLADYEKNLRELVGRLKKTGAKLIWCSTTPVPAGNKGRAPGDEVKYNEAAARVMKDEGVATDDLYAFALPRVSEIQLPKNVHFKGEGYAALAKQVVETITAAMPAK